MRPLVLCVCLLFAGSCGRGEVFQLVAPGTGGSGGGSIVSGQGGGSSGTAGGGGSGGGSPEVALALTEGGGCGDVFLYAANSEDTAMVTVFWPGLLETIKKQGGTGGDFKATEPFAGGPEVFLSRGRYVRDFACGDIVRPDAQRVQGKLKSGSIRIEIAMTNGPGPTAAGPWATLTVENAVFADPHGGELRLEKLIVGPVLVGWLPG